MACCGQKRQSWREHSPRPGRPEDQHPPTLENPTALYHLGDSALLVTGAVSKVTYLFGNRDSPLAVDGRDVAALLAMGRFATSLSE